MCGADRINLAKTEFDTPIARSGEILASLRTARRSRSYTRSTIVYPLGMPYREQYSHSFVSDVFRRIAITVYVHESLTPEEVLNRLVGHYKAWAVNMPRGRR